MDRQIRDLLDRGCSLSLMGFNALDCHFGLPSLPFIWVETSADIAVLARSLDELCFPGVDLADATASISGETWYFRCTGGAVSGPAQAITRAVRPIKNISGTAATPTAPSTPHGDRQ